MRTLNLKLTASRWTLKVLFLMKSKLYLGNQLNAVNRCLQGDENKNFILHLVVKFGTLCSLDLFIHSGIQSFFRKILWGSIARLWQVVHLWMPAHLRWVVQHLKVAFPWAIHQHLRVIPLWAPLWVFTKHNTSELN